MTSTYEDVKAKLTAQNQQHLLQFWNDLTDDQRSDLIADIGELNLDEIQEFFKRATASLEEVGAKLDDRLQPIPDSQYVSTSRLAKEQLRKYEETGLREIAAGKVGVLLMAGGQGTRLGFAHPKGMYDVGLLSGKTLFRVQAERIRTLQRLAQELTGDHGHITWYIMTSEHTIQPTRQYFEANQYFGLRPEDVRMFNQGSLPCFDFNGAILLDEKHRIAKAPDGNGGLYRALRDRGILADMERRGVEHLHAHSVDNILIKVADPVFIGCCHASGADCAAKVVQKSHPHEAVGVVCIVDGKYQVVEYSEITDATAERTNADGQLTFNAGNICNHYFGRRFLEKVGSTYERQLKLHVAKKKIPHIDRQTGERVKPDTPNGIKIEKFVFDVFEYCDHFLTMEVPRDVEFSALKNADSAGKDCPSTARQDLFRLHKRYIEAAGGEVATDECEISSLLSYAGEGIAPLVKGKRFEKPILLKAPEEE